MHADVSVSGSVPCWVSLLEVSLGVVVDVESSLAFVLLELDSPLELDSGCSVVLVSAVLVDPLDSVDVDSSLVESTLAFELLVSGSIDVDPLPDDSLLPFVSAGASSPHAETATNDHANHPTQRHSIRRG